MMMFAALWFSDNDKTETYMDTFVWGIQNSEMLLVCGP